MRKKEAICTSCPGFSSGVSGTFGEAADFNGNTFLRIDGDVMNISPVSVSGWLFPRSGIYPINQFQNTGVSWGVRISAGNIQIFDDTSGVSNHTHFSTPIDYEKWIFFVAGHDSSGFFLYLNDDFIGSDAGTGGGPESVAGNFFMGQRGNGTGFFNGLIDDVRIYNRALTASEIQTLYVQTKDKYLVKE